LKNSPDGLRRSASNSTALRRRSGDARHVGDGQGAV
jgi:hypothetical protein